MNHSTGKPTKKQEARFVAIKFSGCIYCRLWCRKQGRDEINVEPEIHHLLAGGRRIGHNATVGACQWHHRGIPWGDWINADACRRHLGPSMMDGSKVFRAAHCSDDVALEEQNKLIA